MTANNGIQHDVAQILVEKLNVDLPSHDVDLLDTGRLDSLGFVDLVVHLEERFAISVALESIEFDDFRTVRSIAAFVEARLPE